MGGGSEQTYLHVPGVKASGGANLRCHDEQRRKILRNTKEVIELEVEVD